MPTTPLGKAIAARNATTHGLFARDIVLPRLGEDPTAYDALYRDFCAQLNPWNLLEQHYVEKIAAASWRLRRLQRWQAQLYENSKLTEDERLGKLDKVLRHETALHRQIDTAVKMLAKDVPSLMTGRARAAALDEQDCQNEPAAAVEIERETRRHLRCAPPPSDFDFATLDNTHICENEPEELDPKEVRWAEEKLLRDTTENDRKLATLAHDIEEMGVEGFPIYVNATEWKFIQTQHAECHPERAANFDEYFRARFLREQSEARKLLEAYVPV